MLRVAGLWRTVRQTGAGLSVFFFNRIVSLLLYDRTTYEREKMTENILLKRVIMHGAFAHVTVSTLDEPLVLRAETVLMLRLAEGTVVTQSQVEQLVAEAAHQACMREATRLLALRQHSIGELELKLRRKGFEREVAERVIGDFKTQRLLDDSQYAQAVAESLLRRRPCGRGYLLSHLQRRRVDREVAADAVDMVLSEYRQEDLAVAALRKRWREYGQFELETARRKAYNYLARRGFSFQQARAAFDCVQQQETNGGDD